MACAAVFNSYCFLFAFLPVVLAAYWAWSSNRWKLSVLVAAGTTFYSFWDVRFVVLLYAAAVVDYLVAIRVERSARKREWLAVSIAFNLGVLFVFKYAIFAAQNAVALLDLLGVDAAPPAGRIVLPLGISFFVFKTMSYTVDVYRGEVGATRDLLKYLAFIMLFPDLVAGPIVRYRAMDEQLSALPRRLSRDAAAMGATLFAIGLFKKVAIADTLAPFVDARWAEVATLGTGDAWLAVLAYTMQLYFDFSGYSDMALGLAALVGLAFPLNFLAPYQAASPAEFWRRWHISLSTWLRDYLYIPLGGSRKGAVRTRINLAVVMLLGGLWHGAAWTFALWGAYHGALLIAHRETESAWERVPRPMRVVGTFILVMLGWVLFRAADLGVAGAMYAALLPTSVDALASPALPFAALLTLALVPVVLFAPPSVRLAQDTRVRTLAWTAMLFGFALALIGNSASPFLYYQF